MEDNPKRFARYINGMRIEIQDKMNLLCPSFVEEAYQLFLKEEEKLERKSRAKSQGSFRDRRPTRSRGNPIEESSFGRSEPMCKGGDDRGQQPYNRGGSGGRGFQVKCFKCG